MSDLMETATTAGRITEELSSGVLGNVSTEGVSSLRNNNGALVASSHAQELEYRRSLASLAQQAPAPVYPRKKVASSIISRLFSGSATLGQRRNNNETMSQRASASQQRFLPGRPSFSPPPFITTNTAPSSSVGKVMVGLTAKAPWNLVRWQAQSTTFHLSQSSSLQSFSLYSNPNLSHNISLEEYGGVQQVEKVPLLQINSKSSLPGAPHQGMMAPENVLQWLCVSCPTDVIPHILAFCGPQMTSRLQRVSRFWHKAIQEESTWKILCEDLYKWKPGDAVPKSWKQYYLERPCVPVDYTSLHDALNSCSGEYVQILLRPGRYYLSESVTVNRAPNQKVAIATMKLPENIFQSPPALPDDGSVFSAATHQRIYKQRRGTGLLRFIRFTSSAYNDAVVEDGDASVLSEISHTSWAIPQLQTRATLVLRTRRLNEPAIRVLSGQFAAININVEHSSHGLDIWNGNAAIQIQPQQADQEGSEANPRRENLPVAFLNGVRVTSRSGRGVVTIDGGQLTMKQSRVQECAATGVYIGGRGTKASVCETDVMRNGLGSRVGSFRRGGGIARGHSGIYIEQGVADIFDCNISNNTLTGITVVSTENATLNLRDSDLQGNGSFQLELPSRNSRGINLHRNHLDSSGTGRIRASLSP